MALEESTSNIESPLIPNSEKGFGCGDQRQLALAEKLLCDKAEIIVELKKQMRLAGPLVLVSVLQYSFQMISVMFVGHLSELSLASSSMATSFAGVTGFSFMLGMGSALETFCGQAYGAMQYHMLGVHMQSAMLVLTLLSIPIAVLWACTGKIFTILKQDPEISLHAGIYAQWLIPTIVPYGLLQCQLRFLQSQNNVLPLIISTGFACLLHVLSCWTLIFRLGFGNIGAALSISISYWINVFILAIYIKFSPKCEKTWTGFSKEALQGLRSFLRLGVPSALMVCLEYWSYECLVFMAGLLPNPKLETSMLSISIITGTVVFRISYGFGSTVSTRVSNELGAGRPYSARLAVQIVTFLAVTLGLFLSSIAVALRYIWGYMFTNQEEVIKYLASVMPILALSNFMDGIQAVLSGVARGCGWQKIGAFVNLGAYYLVGLPCAISLSFLLHFGGRGLMMGIICGSGLQALLLLVITIRTNWVQQAKEARARVFASTIPTEMSS